LEVQGSGAITAKLNQVYEQEDSGLAADFAKAQIDSIHDETW
jgi:hypothetical protein